MKAVNEGTPVAIKETIAEKAAAKEGAVANTGSSLAKSVDGTVITLYDDNTMLVEFSSLSFVGNGKSIDDYKFVFLFIGKGMFENGRYKKGSVSITGYGGCVVADNCVVVEVPSGGLLNVSAQVLGKKNPIVVSLQ